MRPSSQQQTPVVARNGRSVSVFAERVEPAESMGSSVAPAAKAERSKANSSRATASGGAQSNIEREGWTRETWENFIRLIPECDGSLRGNPECQLTEPGVDPADPTAVAASEPVAPPAAVVRTLAREAALTMHLPSPEVRVGPDPSVNEWDMAVVGYPLWLWTETPATMEASTTQYGITISMSAVRDRVVFDMGDGDTVTCRGMSPLPGGTKAGTPSPNCGYAYPWPSLPEGTYTVTATSHWTVTWSALGYSGAVPVEVSASRELPVGELQAVIVG